MVKDSFTVANKIREIPKELLDHGYRFVSFDVELLFTLVPLSKTINIILDRIYNKKLLKTNIKKRTKTKRKIVALKTLFLSTILFTNK